VWLRLGEDDGQHESPEQQIETFVLGYHTAHPDPTLVVLPSSNSVAFS
jgi:hypothetical protein